MRNVFFTSDEHYDHDNAIPKIPRPLFSGVEEMNEVLRQEHNKLVKTNDLVWHLGDFGWRKSKHTERLQALNGEHRIVLGNHDEGINISNGWTWIGHYKYLKVDGHRLILFHYPILDWQDKPHGTFHLHGHTHSTAIWDAQGPGFDQRINVCVEAWQYRPVHLDEILQVAKKNQPMYDLDKMTGGDDD